MLTKANQRKIALKKRKSMSTVLYTQNSDVICQRLMELDVYKNAKCVMAYYPINNEVNVIEVINDSLKNKIMCLPKTDIEKIDITPHIIQFHTDLEQGAYSINEPKSDCIKAKLVDIDLIIVPIVAFDKSCYRIGYGGGYYDRFLSSGMNCAKIGVAFEEQSVECVIKDKFDIQLDMIITQEKIYKRNNKND